MDKEELGIKRLFEDNTDEETSKEAESNDFEELDEEYKKEKRKINYKMNTK